MNWQKGCLTLFYLCLCICGHAQDKPLAVNALPNTITVMPFQFTENGLGFGAGYERTLGKKGMCSFCLPAMVTFNVANSNRIYDYNTGNYSTGRANAMYYAMPGIKYSPAGDRGKIKYAVGIAAVIASGKISSNLTNLNGLNVTEFVQPHFVAGAMLQNSLNVNAGKNLVVGVEIGVGNSLVNEVGGVNRDNEFLIQGSLKVGHRF